MRLGVLRVFAGGCVLIASSTQAAASPESEGIAKIAFRRTGVVLDANGANPNHHPPPLHKTPLGARLEVALMGFPANDAGRTLMIDLHNGANATSVHADIVYQDCVIRTVLDAGPGFTRHYLQLPALERGTHGTLVTLRAHGEEVFLQPEWAFPEAVLMLRAEGDLERQLPEHGHYLSGLQAIALHVETWRAHPQWHRVLAEYTAEGGELMLLANDMHDAAAALAGTPFLQAPTTQQSTPRSVWRAGLGGVWLLDRNTLRTFVDGELGAGPPHLHAVDELRAGAAWSESRRARAQPPYLALALVLSAFALIVGPLAWWQLIKRRARPFVYLGTVIGGSMLFSLGVVTIALANDRLTPSGYGAFFTLLDQRQGAALHVAHWAVYPPVSSSSTFGVRSNTELAVDIGAPGVNSNDRGMCHIESSSNGLRIAHTLAVRNNDYVRTTQVVNTNAALQIEADGSVLRVTNHLGVAIDELLVGHDGAPFRAGPLQPGETGVAKPVTHDAVPRVWGPSDATRAAVQDLMSGALGDRWFLASAYTTSVDETPFEWGLGALAPYGHVLAGVYP